MRATNHVSAKPAMRWLTVFIVFSCLFVLWFSPKPPIAHSKTNVSALHSTAIAAHSSDPLILSDYQQRLNLLPYTQYWIDEQKGTSAADLRDRIQKNQVHFKPSLSTDVHKIDNKVLWLRFDIKISEPRSRWLLELGSPLIDDVSLHWQNSLGRWESQKAGDVVARIHWPMQTRLPSFDLRSDASDTVSYFLRLENSRFPVAIPVQIYNDRAYLPAQQIEYLLIGAFIGLLLLLAIATMALMWRRKEQSFGAYFAYLIALGLFNLTNLGLLPLFVWGGSSMLMERLNYALAALTAALSPWLVRLIVQPAVHLRMVNFLIILQAIAMLACAGLELIAPNWVTYHLINLGTLFSIGLIYAMLAITWQRGEVITRWVALSFAPVTLSIVPMILRNLGAISNNWLTQYSMPLASLVTLPLLFYALLARSNLRREGRARAAGLPSHDALTGLLNMRNFLQHMQGSITRANGFGHSYGLLLIELGNHAWFMKEHGREMADKALVLTSVRLKQETRDMDVVCRLDESHFVILIEGSCKSTQLVKLATRISASTQIPSDALPVGASLRLSICSALMPTKECLLEGDDAHAQLGWLIAAAEALPPDQRKLVRSIGF